MTDNLAENLKLKLGVAAAQAIRDNLPVDAFGNEKRLKDYADIWGSAARTAILAEIHRLGLEVRDRGAS